MFKRKRAWGRLAPAAKRGRLADGVVATTLGSWLTTSSSPPSSWKIVALWWTPTGACQSDQPASLGALDPSAIREFNEFGSTVDIEHQCSDARDGMITIHEFTEAQFMAEPYDAVIYDHRTGEVADFISLTETEDTVVCQLAHCKGASGKKNKSKLKNAASRFDDAYEVAGQVVKCLPYRNRPQELKEKLLRRLSSGSVLKRGSTELMERILDSAQRKRFEFVICLVQPGLSASKINDQVKNVLRLRVSMSQETLAHCHHSGYRHRSTRCLRRTPLADSAVPCVNGCTSACCFGRTHRPSFR